MFHTGTTAVIYMLSNHFMKILDLVRTEELLNFEKMGDNALLDTAVQLADFLEMVGQGRFVRIVGRDQIDQRFLFFAHSAAEFGHVVEEFFAGRLDVSLLLMI